MSHREPDPAISPQPDRADAASRTRAARTRRFLEAPVAPTLARLAAPNIVAMAVQCAMSIAEGYFAGQMGVTALAGLALVFPLVTLTQALSAGAMGGAISSAVARALGANNESRAAGLVVAAWILAVSIAALSAVLMALFGRPILGLLGAGGGNAVDAALIYAAVYFPGCISLWLCHSTLSVLRGTGNMVAPAVVLVLVSMGSIPLSGAFGLGWGPFPALGMAGLALGMVIAYGIGALAAIAYILSGRAGLSLRRRPPLAGSGLFADILGVGLSASLNSVLTILTVVAMVGLVGRHGEAALAGYGLGARLEFLMIPIVFGIGSAMTSMVGANIGAGQRDRAIAIAWTGSLTAAAIIGGIGVVLAINPDLWLLIFLSQDQTETLAVGRTYFHTIAPFYFFFGLGLALFFASQGAGRMLWPVTGSICRFLIAFGGAMLLGRATDLGIQAVFIAIAAAMLIYGLVIAIAVRASGWR
ncbi:MATE family efflux transporter [Paracoccus onubensis]|uniref:MATE family efflux transporter n=1 Tax=Paracoccus onubensis TaxID=1675788 RepID=A0A418SMP1_9RHOB|nr:MATE family efflux transporter [Paracoccus onubensis]RJE82157.1 MATE family efflux transporter [Paracoccus onubensis]